MSPVMEKAGLTSFTKRAAARPLPTDAQSRCARQACPIAVSGGHMISSQVICEFALKGDCGELFEQRCDKNLHMQLHAAALHSHCLSTPLLLTNILEGAWLFKGTFIGAAPVFADFLSEAASAALRGRATAAAEPSNRCSKTALKCLLSRICQLLSRIIVFCGAK